MFLVKKLNRLPHPIWSLLLVSAQFLLIGGLFVSTFSWPLNVITLAINALATLLGLWAVITMKLGKFNIVPDPVPHVKLVNTGPYRYIRHPMYTSILLFFTPLVIANGTLGASFLFITLLSVLLVKLHYEEHLLRSVLKEYNQYATTTKKIIPLVY